MERHPFDRGIALHRLGRLAEAAACYREALAIRSDDPESLYHLGMALQQQRDSAALETYLELLRLHPGHAGAHNNLAVLYKERGRLDEALAAYREAIRLAPGHAETHANLALLLLERHAPVEAEAACREAIRLAPEYARAHFNLGAALLRQGRPAEAEAAFRVAIRLDPGDAVAHANLGNRLLDKGCLEEAEAACREAIRLRPGNAEFYYNLGNICLARKRPDAAETAWREALRLRPGHLASLINLGAVRKAGGRRAEAEAAWREALRVDPGCVAALGNLGVSMHDAKRFPEAEAFWREALRLAPADGDAASNLGMLLLKLGRFGEGWSLFESRSGQQGSTTRVPDLASPRWRGEALAGRSLLVIGEQGHGDEIQFCRFAPWLRERGASRITLACRPSLAPLIGTLDGVDQVVDVTRIGDLSGCDCWCFLLSLPGLLGIGPETIPACLPYLHVLPERDAYWRELLPSGEFRVGLAWKGSATHARDGERSLPGLSSLAPLWGVAGVRFVGLQKGAGEEEAANPPHGQPLLPLGARLRDYADTAAVVARLDLVITPDTSLAHVCGALARPCWLLLPWNADWRWREEREDSPWYPGVMRLFRQSSPGDWSGVARRVAWALAERVARHHDAS
ncbi:MAG: tetratricopeptide repeat protein [Magnetococcales bacterium]|nr:tetratricopeptide repeat protein [Magnetococcales bacterium]